MSERKPLTLEELREMDGKPAFGVSLITDKPGEWFICRVVEMSKVWFIACAGTSQGFGDKDTYGKTWLAYAYDPPALTVRRGSRVIFARKNLTNTRILLHIATTTKVTRATFQRFALCAAAL